MIDAVKPYLADPMSAVFGEMHAVQDPGGAGVIVCGAVNAKNQFGAFNGNSLFIVFGKQDFQGLWVSKMADSLLGSVPVLSQCMDAGIVFSDEIRLPIAKAMVGGN